MYDRLTEKHRKFCAWLITERKKQLLTQVEAAARCGVSADAYQAWEQGTRRPTPRMRAKLCRGLMLDPLDPHWL